MEYMPRSVFLVILGQVNTVIAQVTQSSDINNIIHQVMISIMHSKQKLFFSKKNSASALYKFIPR